VPETSEAPVVPSPTQETLAGGALLAERDGPVAILTLNRPERLNALTSELGAALDAELKALEADPGVRAIVLTGAGRGFCSGADLSGPTGGAEKLLRDVFNPLAKTMAELDVPIVAAVNGVAAGAGASITFAADLRVAAESARFVLSFVKVGLIPDMGATWTLPRLIGHARAAELALLGREVRAPEALGWGLVNRVVPDGEAVTAAVEIAHQLAAVSGTVGATKAALRASYDHDLDAQLELEAVELGAAQQRPDFAEAKAAFGEKRPPVYAARVVPRR
jgi:2-(1,2-epoxy-1,2-dihydrophenyl)acetyl-CoA isomerase